MSELRIMVREALRTRPIIWGLLCGLQAVLMLATLGAVSGPVGLFFIICGIYIFAWHPWKHRNKRTTKMNRREFLFTTTIFSLGLSSFLLGMFLGFDYSHQDLAFDLVYMMEFMLATTSGSNYGSGRKFKLPENKFANWLAELGPKPAYV